MCTIFVHRGRPARGIDSVVARLLDRVARHPRPRVVVVGAVHRVPVHGGVGDTRRGVVVALLLEDGRVDQAALHLDETHACGAWWCRSRCDLLMLYVRMRVSQVVAGGETAKGVGTSVEHAVADGWLELRADALDSREGRKAQVEATPWLLHAQ